MFRFIMSTIPPYLQDVLNKDTDVTEEHEVLMKYLVFILALDLHRAHLALTQGLFRMVERIIHYQQSIDLDQWHWIFEPQETTCI